MKHIVKVNNIQEAKDSDIRPLIAMDNSGVLFFRGPVPKGFVDFGLPSGTLWSTKNIGATNGDTKESWYGNYYAWGETKAKKDYSTSTYKYANGSEGRLTKYCSKSSYGDNGFTDNLTQLVPEDDVATQTNPAWRMPTKEDFDELLAGTTSRWETDYKGISGLNGRVFTGINGNTMFIPAAGYCNGSDIYDVGSDCSLWSSSLDLDYPYCAYYLSFYSGSIYMSSRNRCNGLSVRPIC